MQRVNTDRLLQAREAHSNVTGHLAEIGSKSFEVDAGGGAAGEPLHNDCLIPAAVEPASV